MRITIFATLLWDRPHIYLIYFWDLSNICLRFVWDMPLIHLRYFWYMPLICLRYIWDMFEIYLRYVWDISEICMIYTLDRFETCNMSKIYIMDGQTLIRIRCDWLSEKMKTRDACAYKNGGNGDSLMLSPVNRVIGNRLHHQNSCQPV